MSALNLPNIREPFIDTRSGQISRPWWIWLQQLMARVGGSDGADISVIEALVRQLIKDVLALERVVSDDPQGQINAGLSRQIEALEAFVAGQGCGSAGLALQIEQLQAVAAAQESGHGFWEDPDMHAVATAAAAGFMSAADKAKLDALGGGFPASYFSAYASATQAAGAGAVVSVICGTELNDALGEYNPATGEFTAANTGLYVFHGHVFGTQTTATNRQLMLYVNGAEVIRMQQFSASSGAATIGGTSGLVNLNAGNVVTMRYLSALADTVASGATATNFSGWRVA